MSEVVFALPDVLPITEKEDYLNGCCHIFTIALAELTNLKVAAFTEQRAILVGEDDKLIGIPMVYFNPEIEGRQFKEVGEGLIHAFCLLGDDNELIFDAMGIRHIDELNREYNLHSQTVIQFYDDPNELLKFGHTFGERDNNVERYIEKTKDYIKTYLAEDLARINQT